MRERQAAQLAAAFILRARRPVGVVRLVKLMYLAEREAMRRSVFPIVFDDIYAMRMGMALSRSFDLMKREPGTPTNGEWERHIAPPSHRGIDVCRGVTDRSLDSLSPDDIKVIDYVWEHHGSKSYDELVHEVHHGFPEWTQHWEADDRRTSAVKVPYEQLYETLCGMNKADADDAASEVAYFQSMDESGGMQKIA